MRIGGAAVALWVLAFGFGTASLPAQAHDEPNPPALWNYQGAIVQADGKTPPDGLRDIEFRLYTQGSFENPSAVPIWGERQTNVQVTNGRFSVTLGSGTEIDDDANGQPDVPHGKVTEAFQNSIIWLGIRVPPSPEIPIRQQIVSAPSAIAAHTAVTARHGVRPGTIVMFAGPAELLPDGWLLCDGSSYSKSQDNKKYKALFDAVGYTWGGADDTFTVPDLRGRALIGEGQGVPNDATSPALTPRALGQTLGEEGHALIPGEMPEHSHAYIDTYNNTNGEGGPGANTTDASKETKTDSGVTGSTGGEGGAVPPHNNMQPSQLSISSSNTRFERGRER